MTMLTETQRRYRIRGFHKETQFQETSIGKIPKSWRIVKLQEVAQKIKAGGTPRVSQKEYWDGDIPFVKIEDMTSRKYIYSTKTFITELGLKNSNAWIIPENSLLIAIYGSIGEVAINRIRVATNQAILGVIPKPNVVDVEYLYYWFLKFKPKWQMYVKRSTQPNLTAEIVKNVFIPLPPLEEQRGIAEVLSSIDNAIEAVERLIEKLEKIKQGLMQVLLTKGIGHKEFQETSIGKIPKEWDIVMLKKVANINDMPKKVKIIEGLVARIPMELIPTNGIYAKYELVSDNDVKSYVIAKAGDILLAKITPSFENGKQGIVPENVPNGVVYATTEVYAITPRQIDRLFLFYLLKWKKYRKLLEYKMTGTTGRKRVPRDALENLQVPYPPLEEQRWIASILKSIDDWIEKEERRKEVLERLKLGLMDLLLTGRVRVEVIPVD